MILINDILFILATIVFPTLISYKKFSEKPKSLVLAYSMIFSLSLLWYLFFILFFIKPEISVFILHIFIYIVACITMLMCFRLQAQKYQIVTFVLVSIFFFIIFLANDKAFVAWDALVSWNRWGMELSSNTYYPMNAGYPILFPSIWSLIYKIQGMYTINIFAKAFLFYPLIILVSLLISIYKEINKKFVITAFILLVGYITSPHSISGFMDYPVAIMGLISILCLYCAENAKKTNNANFSLYIYAAILLAGISVIVKQPGMFFFVFVIIYCLLNLKYLSANSIVRTILVVFISLIYLLSFLFIFYNYATNFTGNLDYLVKLSATESQSVIAKIIKFARGDSGIIMIANTIVLIFLPILFLKDLFKRGMNSLLRFEALLFYCYIIGLLIWLYAFSYDIRNSVWVQMFGITSFCIYFQNPSIDKTLNIDKKVNLSKSKKVGYIIVAIVVMAILLANLMNSNKLLYSLQEMSQSKVGGGITIGKPLETLLSKKSSCTDIYTNNQPVRYNFYLSNYMNQIVQGGWTDSEIPNVISAAQNKGCSDGAYLLLDISNATDSEYQVISKLEKEGKITKNNILRGLYFINPK